MIGARAQDDRTRAPLPFPILLWALIAWLSPLPASGAEGEVPLELQVAVFRRIFSFNQGLTAGARVIVVHGRPDRDRAETVAQAFQKATIAAVLSEAAALDPKVGNVIYAMPSAPVDAV